MIRRAVGLAAAVLIAIASCGSAPPPGELAPGLRTQLAKIDQALASQDYAQARQALDALAEQTSQARNSNRLTVEQADRITAAIARLTADLPQQPPPASPTPSTGTTPATEPGPDASQDDNNTSNDNTQDTDPDDQKGRGDPKDKNKNKDKNKPGNG